MVPSFRKFIGMIVLVLFVITYAFVAMVVGDVYMHEMAMAWRLIYYAVAGVVWVVPAGALIWWMERGGKSRT